MHKEKYNNSRKEMKNIIKNIKGYFLIIVNKVCKILKIS